MGRRRPENVFLPDKWVFPGGRLESEDRTIRAASELHPGDASALSHGVEQPDGAIHANALALAAVRELYEETGHALACRADQADTLDDVWPDFRALHLRPALAPLRLIARAITPPGRPRRYDTRFFIASRADVIEDAGRADGEFTALEWFDFDGARALDLPNITRRVLGDLENMLNAPGGAGFGPVPFYHQEGLSFRRDLIPRP